MIDEVFKQYVAEVVERHFNDALGPDGTTERNRYHLALKSAAYHEIEEYIAQLPANTEKEKMRKYAQDRAQSAIYSLFPKIARKPKRFK